MKIAMLSPYSLARPGGVQGQVVGLARSLRAQGHDVTVVAPGSEGDRLPAAVGEHVLIGRPTELHSNGSVAPVALWPSAALRAERFVRTGGFDVVHVHEPLAPVAAYGLVLTAPLPMVGTYHRSGVSRWVAPLKPLAELVGRRMQVRVAVSEAARETGSHAGGGAFEVLFNGIDMDRFESASPRRDEEGRPVVVFLGRHEQRKGLNVLLDAFAELERPAVLWVIGEGPATEVQRRRYPESDRVRWLGARDDGEVASPPGRRRRPVRPVPARRVVRDGPPRGHGGWLHGGGLGHRGLPSGLGRPRLAGAARRRHRPVPGARERPGRCRRGWRAGLARSPQGSVGVRREPGRWTPWPSVTSTCTSGRSRPIAPGADPGHDHGPAVGGGEPETRTARS